MVEVDGDVGAEMEMGMGKEMEKEMDAERQLRDMLLILR